MKKIFLSILAFLPVFTFAQIRYIDNTFSEIEGTFDIKYGESTTQSGQKIKLKMDVYAPKGDTVSNRPVVILAHGGYFFFGEKSSFEPECRALAESGYVAVSISYRLIDVEDDSMFVAMYAVIDAIHDMKAAVRYFYKDAEATNTFKIDTNNIFIGGYSAGAITALHYAYATKSSDFAVLEQKEIIDYIEESGGMEGQSGNPGYSSKVKGVVNIAGSLFHTSFMDPDEPVLFSIHGTNDMTVPYKYGLTGTTKIMTQGSKLIHKQADKLGLKNKLISLPGADHSGFVYCEEFIPELKAFLASNL